MTHLPKTAAEATEAMIDPALTLNLATTGPMVGLIWLVQLVHYPLMAKVGAANWAEYHHAHTRQITWLVMPLMLGEAAASLWLLIASNGATVPIVLAALALVAWLSTFLWQVPMHSQLSQGFDAEVIRKLTRSNWLRTVAWTLRFVLLLTLA